MAFSAGLALWQCTSTKCKTCNNCSFSSRWTQSCPAFWCFLLLPHLPPQVSRQCLLGSWHLAQPFWRLQKSTVGRIGSLVWVETCWNSMITRYTAVTHSYHLCGWDTMEIWFTPMKFGAVNGTQFRLPKMPSKLLFTKNCPNTVYHGLLILMIKVVHFFAIVMQEHLIPCWYPAEEFNEFFEGSLRFVMTSVRLKMLGTNPRNDFIQSCVVSMFPKLEPSPTSEQHRIVSREYHTVPNTLLVGGFKYFLVSMGLSDYPLWLSYWCHKQEPTRYKETKLLGLVFHYAVGVVWKEIGHPPKDCNV